MRIQGPFRFANLNASSKPACPKTLHWESQLDPQIIHRPNQAF